jgi:hypothetical protein
MTNRLHAPSLSLDSARDFSGARHIAGHLAAAAFVVAIGFVCARILKFTPSEEADCLPEICGPADGF